MSLIARFDENMNVIGRLLKEYRIKQNISNAGTIFNEALKRDYIIKNPMLKIEKTKSEKKDKKIVAFTIEEQQAFLQQLTENEKYRDIFIIALYTGMRMGKILELKTQDIDFSNQEIHISRSLTKDKNDKTILGNTTKTYNSIRTIPITPLFENELKHAVQNRILNIYDLVSIQTNGKLLTVNILNTVFNRICVNAKLSIHSYTITRKKAIKRKKYIQKGVLQSTYVKAYIRNKND